MLGVASRSTPASPHASVKFQTRLYGTARIRRLLSIDGRDSTSVFMRFDFDKLAPSPHKSTMFSQVNKERLHYGPSLGVQVALTPKFNIEAEYNPKFGFQGSDAKNARTDTLAGRMKNKVHKVERVDEFRVRINMNFGNSN
jgi:hypothetical protein